MAKRDLTLSDIARQLQVAPSSVTIVSQGLRRSRRIELALATAVGSTPEKLWPRRYALEAREAKMPAP
ncbi:helix-turn-helix domain-containing protein [Brevundimonas sp. M20]|uniref:helix-turn-helix domain-containing protein n=1 Tax=Brevundimonas sp. M20 TaxID=2591463 RepID=UPI00197AD019